MQFMPNMWMLMIFMNMILFMINLSINYFSYNKFKF